MLINVASGHLYAKPVNLDSSGVTDLDQPGGLLDRYFGLDNLVLLDADQAPLWTFGDDRLSAISLTRWPGFIRGFGVVDDHGLFSALLDQDSSHQSGPVDLGQLTSPFGFGLAAKPLPASSGLSPDDPHGQAAMHAWQVRSGEYSGSYLFTWNDVVGGGPRNHHDLVILVSGIRLSPDVHPVPVPAALWLLGSGLLALFGWVRRRG